MAAGKPRHQRARSRHRHSHAARDHVRGSDHRRAGAGVRTRPGEAGTDGAAHARHDALLSDDRGSCKRDGHVERAPPVLRPLAVSRDVQHCDDRVRVRARDADAALWAATNHGDRDRDAARRPRSNSDAVAAVETRRISL